MGRKEGIKLMSPTDGIFVFCAKRNQRLSVSVCLFRKCNHLREKDGNFFCKFISAEDRRMKKAERRDGG